MSWNEGYKDLGIASQVLHHSATFFLLQPMIPFVLFFAIGEEFQRLESYYLQGLKTIRFYAFGRLTSKCTSAVVTYRPLSEYTISVWWIKTTYKPLSPGV